MVDPRPTISLSDNKGNQIVYLKIRKNNLCWGSIDKGKRISADISTDKDNKFSKHFNSRILSAEIFLSVQPLKLQIFYPIIFTAEFSFCRSKRRDPCASCSGAIIVIVRIQ